jgi:hypothetical protein
MNSVQFGGSVLVRLPKEGLTPQALYQLMADNPKVGKEFQAFVENNGYRLTPNPVQVVRTQARYHMQWDPSLELTNGQDTPGLDGYLFGMLKERMRINIDGTTKALHVEHMAPEHAELYIQRNLNQFA